MHIARWRFARRRAMLYNAAMLTYACILAFLLFGYMWLNIDAQGTDTAAYEKWHKSLPRIEKKAAAKVAKGTDLIIAAVANSKGSIERGGEIWILSAETGEKIRSYPLPAAPAFDGLAIVNGRILVTLQDTTVVCLEGKLEE